MIRAIAFTDRGQAWEETLGFPVDRGIPVMQWAAEHFHSSEALLFIGACGIAVRAIAPLVRDKTSDPAVLVMDEAGKHVISLLSGHLGGANVLAREISRKTGAEPVITTATDLRGVPAVDTWAKENNCAIENPEAVRHVSSAALAGKTVGVAVTGRLLDPPFPVTLWLRPRRLVLGTGCRKDLPPEVFEEKATAFLKENGVSLLSLRAVATIDRKKDEEALKCFCEKYGIPLLAYSAEELKSVPRHFAHSDFVEKTVGVGNVCERAAVLAGGRLLVGKTSQDGLTLALAGGEEE